MKSTKQRGYSFFKVLVIMAFAVLVLSVGIPSVRTFAGQTSLKGCEANVAAITRLENEYYKQLGKHTDEYVNLDFVSEESDLFRAGLLSKEDINCKKTDGQYQWQEVNGQVVLVCNGH